MDKRFKNYTYIGERVVKAMPMIISEAYKRKLLKEGEEHSEGETDKAGYLVEYNDGYQSWLPSESFEKNYKPFETRLDRLRIEYDELRMRSKEMDAYMNEGFEKVAAKVGASQAALLVLKHSYLHNYLEVLEVLLMDAEKNMKK